VIRITTKI